VDGAVGVTKIGPRRVQAAEREQVVELVWQLEPQPASASVPVLAESAILAMRLSPGRHVMGTTHSIGN